MNLLDVYRDAENSSARLLERMKAPLAGGVAPVVAGGAPSALQGALGQQPQMQTAARQYQHNTGWPYACIRAIAQRIAGQPVHLGRHRSGQELAGARPRLKTYSPHQTTAWLKQHAESMEVIDSHPLLDALARPNAMMTWWILSFVTVASLELTGEGFWWIFNSKRDRTGEWTIMPLPSSWVAPVHSENALFVGWEIRPTYAAKPVTVPAEEIARIYYPDPSNPLGRVSPLQALALAVVADESMQDAQRRGMSQGLWPGVAVTVGRNPDVNGIQGSRPVLNKEQRAQVIQAVKDAYRGVANYEEPVILDGFIEKIARLTNTPREMDFGSSGKITKGRITQGLGVNPIILGEIESANRASAAAADGHFCSTTVNPKIELISSILTASVVPLFAAAGERLCAWIEPAHASDPDLDLQVEKLLTQYPSLTVNELRARHNIAPMEGGDVLWVSNTVAPVDLSEVAAADEGGEGQGGGGGDGAASAASFRRAG